MSFNTVGSLPIGLSNFFALPASESHVLGSSQNPQERVPYLRREKRPEPPRGARYRIIELVDSYIDASVRDRIRTQLLRAVNDTTVERIILFIDCPGGSALHSNLIGEEVESAAKKKHVTAFTEGHCTSGAYEFACGATEIIAARQSVIGSIGTVLVWFDDSELFKRLGVRTIVFSTGRFKGMGAPGKEFTAEQIEEIQRSVNSINSLFLADVSRRRGIPMKTLVEEIATGQVWIAREALERKLIDRIESWDSFMERISARHTEPFGDLYGGAAYDKFNELVCETAKVDYAWEAPDAVLARLNKDHPVLARTANEHAEAYRNSKRGSRSY